jgi:regulator of protease activity HflC (stomatin/prohibitin superfamily)
MIYIILFLLFIGFILLLPTIFMFSFTVDQQSVALIESFGKFKRTAKPGLNFKTPYVERIAGRVNLRVQQLDVAVDTKTKDNVFVNVLVAVQYYVLEDRVYEAYYKLSDPERQITSFVFDVVRAKVPQIILDDVFEKKDDIADAVKSELESIMGDFGYGILKSLVTDIDPNEKVKDAMNEINAAQRLKAASLEKGEADKILVVKAAEAEAESNALRGKGIADQRQAIISGLQESMVSMKDAIGVDSAEVMNLVLMTQYFDTLKDIGAGANTNSIMIPHSPSALGDLSDQIRNAVITANEVSKNS